MPKQDETAWDALIGDLYLAAFDSGAAARVARAITDLTGGAHAHLWRLNPLTGALIGRVLTNRAHDVHALYATHWHRHDPWIVPMARQRSEGALRGSEVICDEDLARSDFHNGFGRSADSFHLLGAVPPGPDPQRGWALTVTRPRSMGAFEDGTMTLFDRLLPHARRALSLEARLESGRPGGKPASLDAGKAALHALDVAVVVLGGDGTPLLTNAAAEACERAGAVRLCQRGEDGRISARLPADTAWLRGAAAEAAGGGAGGARQLRDGGGVAWAASITPLPGGLTDPEAFGTRPGRALLVLRALRPPTATQQIERKAMALFGLTAAEAEVAVLLMGGLGPEEIAAVRAVRLSTVRTLLRRAMEKSEASNLRGLVQILGLLGL